MNQDLTPEPAPRYRVRRGDDIWLRELTVGAGRIRAHWSSDPRDAYAFKSETAAHSAGALIDSITIGKPKHVVEMFQPPKTMESWQ